MQTAIISQNTIYEIVKKAASHYINNTFTDTTNLLGITPTRNIVYILTDIENQIDFKINDSFINEIQDFSVEKVAILISKYIE
ncbi:MAG: hypothetical protein FWG90_07340 [Oscillospiraceae bacterium]|nr:hypothetical protein [Oscillospiraceae bacterium]